MVRVTVMNAHPRLRARHNRVVRYVRRVLKRAGRRQAEVTVIVIGSRRSRRLNRTFLRHDYVTDVMSFILEDGANLEAEIYVNIDRAVQQAREYGVSREHELARLVVHGALHLVGYDDRTNKERHSMQAAEDEHVNHWFPDTKQ